MPEIKFQTPDGVTAMKVWGDVSLVVNHIDPLQFAVGALYVHDFDAAAIIAAKLDEIGFDGRGYGNTANFLQLKSDPMGKAMRVDARKNRSGEMEINSLGEEHLGFSFYLLGLSGEVNNGVDK
jgi:hypothetical protein